MTRRVIALCLSGLIAACSGERSQSNDGLNSGNRSDAGDAESARSDAQEPTPSPDGGDAALDEPDASSELDGGAGDAGDSATAPDTSTDDPDSFSLRVLYHDAVQSGVPVVFSQSDGTVDKYLETDSQGLVTSTYAPGMVTVVLPYESGIVTRGEIFTINAPALGDHLTVEMPANQALTGETNVAYRLNLGEPPQGSYYVHAYAGREACAAGEVIYVYPQPSEIYDLRRSTNCVVEANSPLLAMATGEGGEVVGFTSATLPAPGATAAIALGTWQAPDALTVDLSSAPSGAELQAAVWLLKGSLRAPSPPYSGSASNRVYPLSVPRSLVDSVEVEGRITRNLNLHRFRKNRPPATANEVIDFATALPEVPTMTADFTTQLRPTANWTLSAASTPADAVLVSVTWHWVTDGENEGDLTWRILSAPGALTTTYPVLPQTGKLALPLIPPNISVQPDIESVMYFESDQQNGFRDFLKEPLRLGGQKAYNLLESERWPLDRAVPSNATVRSVLRYQQVDVGT